MSITSFTIALLMSAAPLQAETSQTAGYPAGNGSAAETQVIDGRASVSSTEPTTSPPPSVASALTQPATTETAPTDEPVAPSVAQNEATPAPDGTEATETAAVSPEVAPEEEGEIIVVAARRRYSRADPLEGLNVKSFETIQAVDKAVVGPVAKTYKETIPRPIRSGLRNVLRNLTEPVVFLNYMLQLKFGKAAETVGRFAINSTIGVAGLFDTAKKKPFNLPYRFNSFGHTFGYYGIKSGPYMYLPFIGPTTVRDMTGRILDMMVMPFAIGKPFNQPVYAIPTTAIRLIDERAEAEEEHQQTHIDADDPYGTVRDTYLRQRQAEIDELRGRKPPAANDDEMPDIPPVTLPDLPEMGSYYNTGDMTANTQAIPL